MYHCHIQLYLIGIPNEITKLIRSMPPLEHFTHGFSESAVARAELAAQADLILVCRAQWKALRAMAGQLKEEADRKSVV